MFEFAAAYGFTPPREYPWQLFAAGLARTGRFGMRTIYQLVRGVNLGASGMLGGGFETDLAVDELFRASFPVKREGPRLALDQSATRRATGEE